MANFDRGVPVFSVPVVHHRGVVFPAVPSSFPVSYSHGYPYYGNLNPHRIPSRRGGDCYPCCNDNVTSINPSLVLDGEESNVATPRKDVLSMEVMIAKNMEMKNHWDVESEDEDGVTKICSVCENDLCEMYESEIGVLDCGHEYHACCIKNWLKRKNVCPLCDATAV